MSLESVLRCPPRKLRTFSLSRIDDVRVKGETHRERMSPEQIRKKIASTFGIFITDEGRRVVTVKLRFAAALAAYIGTVVFHPDQEAKTLEDGRLEVSFPSTINRELIGEVMRFIDGVEVVEPKELRDEVRAIVKQAAARL